jgi:hypothetical protein
MPTAQEMASKNDFEAAKERGITNGFEGIFLDHFIENELRMMQKWQNRRQVAR